VQDGPEWQRHIGNKEKRRKLALNASLKKMGNVRGARTAHDCSDRHSSRDCGTPTCHNSEFSGVEAV